MIIVRCPNSPEGGSITQNGRFLSKIALRLLQSFFVWILSGTEL